NFASAGQTIPAPGLTTPNGNGSYIPFSTPSQMKFTGTPTLGLPSSDGIIVVLINLGNFPATFQTDSFASTGLNLWAQYITLGFQESIQLRSQGGKWYQIGQGFNFVNLR